MTQNPATDKTQHEQHVLRNPSSIAADVAKHLRTRCSAGRAVIVVERPLSFLAILRKQWMKLARVVQRERASTLDPVKRTAFSDELARIYSLRFTGTDKFGESDVLIIEPADWACIPQDCATLYICTPTEPTIPSTFLSKLSPDVAIVSLYFDAKFTK